MKNQNNEQAVNETTVLGNEEKIGKVRYVIAILMLLAVAINYLDRTIVSAAAPTLMKDLNIGPTEMGLVMSAFFFSYMPCQIPSGWLADRIGQRICLTIGVLWWSIMTMATAGARTVSGLFGARFLMGIGEASVYPCNTGIAAKWFPDNERGRVSALFDSGSKFGTAFAMPFVAWMVGSYGWQFPFIICGALGIVFAGVWYYYYNDPEKHKFLKAYELEYIRRGQQKKEGIDKHQPMKWYELLKYRNVLAMCSALFLYNYVMFFFVTWFPTYLIQVRGMSLMTMGWMAMLPPLCGILAQWCGGIFTDWTYKKTGNLTLSRKINLVAGLLLASVILGVDYVDSNAATVAIFCLAYAGMSFAASVHWCLPSDIAPRNMTSVLGGIQNTFSGISGILGPVITGYFISVSGSFSIPFFIAGTACFTAALIYAFVLKDIKPITVNSPDPLKI